MLRLDVDHLTYLVHGASLVYQGAVGSYSVVWVCGKKDGKRSHNCAICHDHYTESKPLKAATSYSTDGWSPHCFDMAGCGFFSWDVHSYCWFQFTWNTPDAGTGKFMDCAEINGTLQPMARTNHKLPALAHGVQVN